jgi:hypothetical protein
MWSFIKICLICIIGINRLKEKFQKNIPEHMLNYSMPCSCSSNLSSFWLILKHIKTILSGTSSSIKTKLRWNSHWMVLFQNGVRQLRSPAKMAATVQLRCYYELYKYTTIKLINTSDEPRCATVFTKQNNWTMYMWWQISMPN